MNFSSAWSCKLTLQQAFLDDGYFVQLPFSWDGLSKHSDLAVSSGWIGVWIARGGILAIFLLLRSPTNACITSVVDRCLICLFLPGVSKAVEHINKTIAPALISKVGAICLLLTSVNASPVCPNSWMGYSSRYSYRGCITWRGVSLCIRVHVNKLPCNNCFP